MSMNGSFCAITATLHARLRRDLAMMKRLVSAGGGLSDDVMANLLATAPAAVREQIREQLLAHKAAMDAAPDIDPADLGARVDIDKAWHAVHFLVAASAYDVRPGDVATTFMLGGQECGDDVGYGPARMHGPDAVAAIAEALPEAIALRSRFDPGAMAAAELYPGGWDQPLDDLWDWVSAAYSAVRAFYREAATAGHAVVVWVH